MATTYLEVVNNVLAELNEVLLSTATFAGAKNIQLHTKEAVNKAYFDLNNPEHKWPWLATAASQDDYLGNTYIETVAGQRWYLLKSGSADMNADYGHIDWDNFTLTTEGVAGEVVPHTIRNVPFIPLEEWKDHFLISESLDKSNSQAYGVPKRVIRNPDGRRFGLSPLPDKVYRMYFFAWDRPAKLVAYGDAVEIPDQFVSVLHSRARYYAWQRKENPQQAAIAEDEYKKGLRAMRQQSIDEGPKAFTDTRTRYV